MIRIGIAGTDNGHAHLFSGWINGWVDDVPIPGRPAGYLDSFYLRWAARRVELQLEGRFGPARTPMPGVRVVRIWGEDRAQAESIARACNIDEVVDSPAAAAQDVDAVMVLSDAAEVHLAHATPALEAGLPTYIDKPLAPSAEEAQAIAVLADRHGARWFSASSLGFSHEARSSLAHVEGLGGMRGLQIKIQNRWWDYGIHAVEFAAFYLGRDVRTVRGHTVRDSDVLTLEYGDGRLAVLQHLSGQSRPSYCATLFCGLGTWFVDVADSVVTSLELIEAFVKMVERGTAPPLSAAEAIRSIEIVAAGREALATGSVIELAPFSDPSVRTSWHARAVDDERT